MAGRMQVTALLNAKITPAAAPDKDAAVAEINARVQAGTARFVEHQLQGRLDGARVLRPGGNFHEQVAAEGLGRRMNVKRELVVNRCAVAAIQFAGDPCLTAEVLRAVRESMNRPSLPARRPSAGAVPGRRGLAWR
jgi:hypothetical protein